MKTIGFIKSHKNNEKRIALLPKDAKNLEHKNLVLIEEGYGEAIGYPDHLYEEQGLKIAPREEVLKQDIIVDVKLGDADYLDKLEDGKILFGWAHAAQGIEFTNACIKGKHTVYAWEDMFENGRYIFYRNREIAGEAAVMHAYTHYGSMPYDTSVAIIGNGQTARGAMRVLYGLGVKELQVFGRRQEALFREKMYDFDVIINCVMWDITRKDRLIYREDLKKMKPGAMIIDVSIDPELEIETSVPTTIDNPVYTVDGVLHYCVDNTPALFSKTVSGVLSEGLINFHKELMEEDEKSKTLADSLNIKDGKVISDSVKSFRLERGLNIE